MQFKHGSGGWAADTCGDIARDSLASTIFCQSSTDGLLVEVGAPRCATSLQAERNNPEAACSRL